MIGRVIIKRIAPADIWQFIAQSQKKYVLIGDGDHSDVAVKENVVAALPILSEGGIRHLGLEQDSQREQGPVDAFQFASARARKSGRDVEALLRHITSAGQKCLIRDEDKLLADHVASYQLYTLAREKAVRVHCMNNILGITEFFRAIHEPEAEKFGRFGEYAMHHLKAPPRITHTNLLKLDALMGLYQTDYNFSLDRQRANNLKRLSGKSRAALVFGARHFGRHDGTSIEAHLPPASSAFVYVASAARVAERLAEAKGPQALKLPDFAIETDTGRGLVLLSARSNGLV